MHRQGSGRIGDVETIRDHSKYKMIEAAHEYPHAGPWSLMMMMCEFCLKVDALLFVQFALACLVII